MKIFVEFCIKLGERYQCKIDTIWKLDILALKSSANILKLIYFLPLFVHFLKVVLNKIDYFLSFTQ